MRKLNASDSIVAANDCLIKYDLLKKPRDRIVTEMMMYDRFDDIWPPTSGIVGYVDGSENESWMDWNWVFL